MRVGAKVVVQRDETKYPSSGTWPRFRGKKGTVVSRNGNEYGVVFGNVRRDEDTGRLKWGGTEVVTWFKIYEITERNK